MKFSYLTSKPDFLGKKKEFFFLQHVRLTIMLTGVSDVKENSDVVNNLYGQSQHALYNFLKFNELLVFGISLAVR